MRTSKGKDELLSYTDALFARFTPLVWRDHRWIASANDDEVFVTGTGGREQDPLRRRGDVHSLLKEVDPGHARHTMVGQQERDLLASQLEFAQHLERSAPSAAAMIRYDSP